MTSIGCDYYGVSSVGGGCHRGGEVGSSLLLGIDEWYGHASWRVGA